METFQTNQTFGNILIRTLLNIYIRFIISFKRSFGVLIGEILSYGTQPYQGKLIYFFKYLSFKLKSNNGFRFESDRSKGSIEEQQFGKDSLLN